MNTQPTTSHGHTDLPDAGASRRRVEQARQLFQRTLAKWASDVLLLRHQRMNEPTWAGPADGSAALMTPLDDEQGWQQAA